MGIKLTFVLWLICAAAAFGQCVTPDFTAPAAACKGERISLTPDNTYNSLEWDLCSGELAGTPTATVLTDNYGGYGFTMDLVEYQGDYYGFFLSHGSNKLYRLDFGTDVNSQPALVDLGGLGKSSSTWSTLKIVKEGGNFIGFIIDQSTIYRISFGDSPANAPQAPETYYTGSLLNTAQDIIAVNEGNNKYLFITNSGDENIVSIKFNSSFTEPSNSSTIKSIAISGSHALSGISIIKDCDKWYLVVGSIIVQQVYKLAMDDLDDTSPVISSYSIPSAGGVAVVKDNDTFMIFAQALNPTASLYRLTFGSDLSGDPVSTDELKNFGYPVDANPYALAMYKVKSDWLVVSAENHGANMYRLTFPQSCVATEKWSAEINPVITTQNSGNFNFTLDVTNASGLHSSKSHSLTVSSSTSPDIEFTSANICANNDVNFDSQNTSGDISTYDWDFDDATSSGSPDPVHRFAAGTYNVALKVTAVSTGCTNTAAHPLKIYPAPVADFQAPSGLVCTNNNFTFTNNLADVYDGAVTYQWFVDGTQVSTARDLVYDFNTTGSSDVKLVATIPGCSDNKTKTIAGILAGPIAAYTINGNCQAATVNFQNTSADLTIPYSWDFDNGSTSNSSSASTTFDTPGTYTIALKAFGSNGCITTVEKDLVVYSKPTASFVLDLPPFSCSGTPSQFHDASASMPDSNIDTWDWTFGDGGSTSGKNPVHTYATAGDFNVGLTVTSDKGCTGSTTQQVTITQSPVASFDPDPACVNKPTKLNDSSTGGVVGWQWKIGSTIYTSQNPQHTFTVPGNYSVRLSVTGQNGCTNVVTKPLVVPVVPTVAFEVENPCAGQPAVFTDITSSAADPVAQQNWTFDNNANATGPSVEFQADIAGTYSAQLQVKTQSGCVYSGSKQVVIFQSPVASFTTSDESGPPPFAVQFTNTSSGAVSYQWNFNDGTQASTEVSPAHTFSEFGDYAVDLMATNNDGCRTTESRVISVVTPQNELALEDFTLLPTEPGGSFLGYIRVRNNGNYRIDKFSLSYDVGGGVQIGETLSVSIGRGEAVTLPLSKDFTSPGQSAYVCIELADDENLADNKACATFDNLAIILRPYPNPTDSYLTVESILSAPGTVRVRLYSASGGLAYDRSFDASTGLSRLSLDVQDLSPGIYVTLVEAGGTTSSQRVLIAR